MEWKWDGFLYKNNIKLFANKLKFFDDEIEKGSQWKETAMKKNNLTFKYLDDVWIKQTMVQILEGQMHALCPCWEWHTLLAFKRHNGLLE